MNRFLHGSRLYQEPAYPPEELNPLALAYLGDAIYEVYVRQHVLTLPNHRPHILHRRSSNYVSAKAQARALHALMPELTESETDVVKRGRNAKSGTAPKNAEMIDYRHSTAFECLIGYLYYRKDEERLAWVMHTALQAIEQEDKGARAAAAVSTGTAGMGLTGDSAHDARVADKEDEDGRDHCR